MAPQAAAVFGVIDTPGYVGANLRAGPSTLAATTRVIPTGTRVELLDGRVAADSLDWRQIRTLDGEIGWISSGTIAD